MSFTIKIKEKSYINKHDKKKIVALKNIDIKIKPKEFICIVGPSGCGKTTLMNIIGGLIKGDGQKLLINNREIDGNANFGYVFQTSRLLPWLTLKENVKLICKQNSVETDKIIKNLLTSFGLIEFLDSYPNNISGGMRRKVSLARAFVNKPEILLMDEPFISLDQPTSENLYEVLVNYWQKNPTTIILITHNIKEALLLGDRILFFSKRPGTVVVDYKNKCCRRSLKIDSKSILAEYNKLTKKYPKILKGLV